MSPFSPLGDSMSITTARANLGPLVRWVARTRERITITERANPAAVLISIQELADLQAAPASPSHPGITATTRPLSRGDL